MLFDFDPRNLKANIKDKATTVKGLVLLLVGLCLSVAPLFPRFTALPADVYGELLDYVKYVSGASIVLGLILIGAIKRKDE